MIQLFSSREIAIGIYAALLIAYVLIRKRTRSAAVRVIKTACSRKLVIPFVLLLIYALLLTWVLTCFKFWKWYYLKDIVIWVIFAGVPLCYKAVDNKEKHYFRDSITENLKLTALVEFFTGTFTFSLLVEMIIQPILTLLVVVQEASKRDEKNSKVTKLISVILTAGGIWIFFATIKEAVVEYSELNAYDLLITFCIPLAFSLLYLPVAYLFRLYAKYEVLFIRMDFCSEDNKITRRRHKRRVFRACGLSYSSICRFERDYLCRMYRSMSEKDFLALIMDFKKKPNKNQDASEHDEKHENC